MQNNTLKLNTLISNHIRSLFHATDENHRLCLPVWPAVNIDSADKNEDCVSYEVFWNDTDCETLIFKVCELIEKLQILAPMYHSLRKDPAGCQNLLPDLYSVWTDYLTPLNTDGLSLGSLDDSSSIEFKVFFHELLTEQESELYSRYLAAAKEDACGRIGRSEYAYDVITRADRLCHLLALHAPDSVVECEAKILAETMLMHEYSESYVYIVGLKNVEG